MVSHTIYNVLITIELLFLFSFLVYYSVKDQLEKLKDSSPVDWVVRKRRYYRALLMGFLFFPAAIFKKAYSSPRKINRKYCKVWEFYYPGINVVFTLVWDSRQTEFYRYNHNTESTYNHDLAFWLASLYNNIIVNRARNMPLVGFPPFVIKEFLEIDREYTRLYTPRDYINKYVWRGNRLSYHNTIIRKIGKDNWNAAIMPAAFIWKLIQFQTHQSPSRL